MKNFLIHKRFMRIALDEARKGSGRVSPNPKVGCVVVKNDRILARGYHQRFGGPHAELVALKKAGKEAKGATLYITLEPCCYFGKTPPCANTIIESGIKEVVAAMADPNPANNGRGFKLLRKKGIKVQVLCPGFTKTDFHRKLSEKRYKLISSNYHWMTADEVVDYSLKCLKKNNRAICIPGIRNRLYSVLIPVLPKAIYYRIADRMTRE